MRLTRCRAVTGLAVFTAAALVVTRGDAKPESLTSIVPGVWFREGDPSLGHSNNQIIEMKDYLIVVDANFPSGARATLADIKRASRKPVKYVFITHHHGDHLYGASVWTMDGATSLAYKGVADEIRRYEPKRWQENTRADVRELRRNSPEAPMQTFEKSPFVLDDGKRRVEFYFFGWAHTRGDGWAYLPNEQVLCTGDAVVNGPFNYTTDANIGNWPNVLRSVSRLKVKHVLPGHGAPGGPELIDGQARFMIELVNAVKQASAQGKRLQDIVQFKSGKPVGTSIQLSAAVKTWVGSGLPTQVQDAYEEVTQATPHGALGGGR